VQRLAPRVILRATMHILDELKARGFIKDMTDPVGLRARMDEGQLTFYCGYDPSNSSLTAGNLVAIMLQTFLQRAGHRPLVILGGGTSLIGDPSGKQSTREVLTTEQIQSNLESQRPQFGRFLKLREQGSEADNAGELIDNAAWLKELNYIEFLRDVGSHFSVNEMITADTYARRLREQQHLSFVEFNYRLVQAYDFLHLHREHDCVLQVGGSDQWGNCVAGTELIRKTTGGKAWVMTTPLLTTADGQKMGKSEKGAVWLDAALTSTFEYFQFWMNCDDRDISTFLKMFTFLDLERIAELEALGDMDVYRAKAILAWHATALCHGREAASSALATSMLLFDLERLFAWQDIVPDGEARAEPDIPRASVDRALLDEGVPLYKLFAEVGLAGSGKQARNLATQGGAYVNGEAHNDPFHKVGVGDLRDDGTLLLRAGKKRYCLVRPA
jgi:tyrosyl-tRNA synthetase